VARQEKIVVDASVAFKWYVVEDGTGVAMDILDDYQKGIIDIASVSLMPFEVLNALRYAPDTSIIDLQKVAKSLDKLCLEIHHLEGELSLRAVENALRYGITVYDSSYLSLGEIEKMDVYTADEKLLAKTGGTCLKPLSGYHSSE
jgi:predicted nucleic acid-binding protein